MKYRALGKNQLKVSELCLGTMMFADQTELAEARSIVDHAKEQGCNFIDTADAYSLGGSESMLGQLLKGQREQWVLATKVGMPMSQKPNMSPNTSHYSRSWMLQACEASLRRLNTDYIDLYYMHRDYNGMDFEEPLRAMDDLLRSGKIRYWGLSNFRGWRIAEIVNQAKRMNIQPPSACQPYYNLLKRQPEQEVLEACAHYGLGVVPYSPIARGVLSGKYVPGAPPETGTRASRNDKRLMETEFRDDTLMIAQRLRTYCEPKGVALSHFAVAWVLAHKSVSSVIAGPRTLAQWQDYFGALEIVIRPEDEAFVDALVTPGHASSAGYNDPNYPLNGR
jgi:aryl-alcohol dehydrogenase-like predicted oxidoreductase